MEVRVRPKFLRKRNYSAGQELPEFNLQNYLKDDHVLRWNFGETELGGPPLEDFRESSVTAAAAARSARLAGSGCSNVSVCDPYPGYSLVGIR